MDFPKEMIEELFIRLPVKSLMKFKCVSKDWNDSISDDKFRRLYRCIQQNKSNVPTGFICHGHKIFKEYIEGVYGYWENEFIYTSKNDVEREEHKSLGYLEKFRIIASSKGLLLLSRNPSSVSVYDLVSKKHVDIPELPHFEYIYSLSLGFKCEEYSTKQGANCHRRFRYKVVGLTSTYGTKPSYIYIYSSETGNWEKSLLKANLKFSLLPHAIAKVIGRVFHWLEHLANRIIAYDSDDPNRRVEIIELPSPHHTYSERLIELEKTKDGSLQLININNMTMKVWILSICERSYMDQDIVDASRWSLAHSISLLDICCFHDTHERLCPLIIGVDPADTDIIYLNIKDQLCSYNYHEGKVVSVSSQKISSEAYVFVYVEWPTWPCL